MAWTATEVEARVLAALRRHAPAGSEITPASRLTAELGLDSVAAMNLLLELEDSFGVTLPLAELPALDRVRDLVDLLLAQLNLAAARPTAGPP